MWCRAVPCSVRAVSVQCRALPCIAVLLYGAVPCCAVIRAALDLLVCTCQVSFDEVSSSSTKVHHTRFVRTTFLNHIKCSKLSSALAQQCAAQHRAVPCGAVLCRTALCFLSNTQYQVSYEVPGTRYQVPPGAGMYVCTRVFSFFMDFPPPRSSSRFIANYFCTAP